MNIFFRVDANSFIGMGHIMRCLSIADAFHNVSISVFFVLADESVKSLVNSRGYKTIVLNTDYSNMESELTLWKLRSFEYTTPDILIVDSYYVTSTYLTELRRQMKGILIYIDDILSLPYPVDVLVNYNTYASSSAYEELYRDSDYAVPASHLILGPSYAPLRSMFRDIPRRTQSKNIENVLVSTGGSDELHLALAIIKKLCAPCSYNGDIADNILAGYSNQSLTDTRYHFLIGAMNADTDKIKRMTYGRTDVVIHHNVQDMRGLIEGMDICISAAGSTLYEICSCGVPLITFSLADNQMLGASAFASLGLAVNVGDLRSPGTVMSGELDSSAVDRILLALVDLSTDFTRRVEVGSKMQRLIDGYGADRMVERIMQLCES